MFMRLSGFLDADLKDEEENSYLLGNLMINGAEKSEGVPILPKPNLT
jgi:hypothetical protein